MQPSTLLIIVLALIMLLSVCLGWGAIRFRKHFDPDTYGYAVLSYKATLNGFVAMLAAVCVMLVVRMGI